MSTIEVSEAMVGSLTTVVARVPWAATTCGAIAIAVGYAEDPPGRAGLAHLTEHVCVGQAASQYGVTMAGRTEPRQTRYSAQDADARHLIGTLLSPLIPREHSTELHAGETQAVLTELARLRDQPQLTVAAALAGLAFPQSDFALRDLTTPTTLAAVRPVDVTDFRRARYHLAGTILCLAGPYDPDELLAMIERKAVNATSGPPGRPGEAVVLPAPDRTTGWRDCVLWAAATPPAKSDKDRLARQVALEILTGTPCLLDMVAAQCGVRSIGVATLPGRDQDLVVMAFPAETGLPGRLRWLPEIPLEMAQRARRSVRTRSAFEQQTPVGMVGQLMQYALSKGPWPDLDGLADVPDAAILAMVAEMAAGAVVWRIADGVLEAVEEA